MSLMEMSFSGAVLILVILAVRAGFKNRLPKMTFAALWMIALFRLLIPFSISSSWSVYTFLPDAESIVGQTQHAVNSAHAWLSESESVSDLPETFLPQGTEGLGNAEEKARQGYLPNQSLSLNQDLSLEQELTLNSELSLNQESPLKQKLQSERNQDLLSLSVTVSEEKAATAKPSIWSMIWAAGFVLCTIYFAWIYHRCYREFQMSLPIDSGITGGWHRTHPLRRKLSIRQSDKITSPLSYGIWRPVILLPKSTKWEERFQLRYVLEHEYVHIQHFDSAAKLLMVAALCIHWFNPFVWIMYIFFNRDMELYCDETVVRRFGEEEKSAYAMTLIEMEEEKSGLIPLCNNFSKNAIEERIGAIMKIKKLSRFTQGMAAALVCIITLLFATSCGTYQEAEKIRGLSVEDTEADTAGKIKAVLEAEAVAASKAEEAAREAEQAKKRNASAAEAAEKTSADAETDPILEADIDVRFLESDEAEAILKSKGFSVYKEYVSEETTTEAAYDSEFEVKGSLPEEYEDYGVTVDAKTNKWMYRGKGIAVIYEKDYGIYTNDSIPEKKAIYLEVKRDKNGEIIEFCEVTKKEMQRLIEED